MGQWIRNLRRHLLHSGIVEVPLDTGRLDGRILGVADVAQVLRPHKHQVHGYSGGLALGASW